VLFFSNVVNRGLQKMTPRRALSDLYSLLCYIIIFIFSCLAYFRHSLLGIDRLIFGTHCERIAETEILNLLASSLLTSCVQMKW